jgi:CheY-like chemotaxis protein
METVELAQIVANAIEIASPAIEEHSHKLVVSVAATGIPVIADGARLAQVLVNLLTNAARYTPSGGRIEVRARVKRPRIVLSVKDDGIGIDTDHLVRIFDPFVQAPQARDREKGGLGLGLAIARNLVELHGGTLSAKSDGVGRGSEFVVELPLANELPVELPASIDERQISADLAARVLIVDDNPDAASLLAEALGEMGHIVRVSHDGPSALETAAQFRPHCALLDIGLPAMDGWELAERMSTSLPEPRPRLIAISGYGQEGDRQRSIGAGFVEHLVKPIDLGRLETMIRALVSS